MKPIKNKVRLVLDTNIVLDLLHFKDPGIDWLAQAITTSEVLLLTSEDTMNELSAVLNYPQFGIDFKQAQAYLAIYQTYALQCADVISTVAPQCKDKDDQKFLDLALSAHANMLITKDKALLALARYRTRLGSLRILRPTAAMQEFSNRDTHHLEGL